MPPHATAPPSSAVPGSAPTPGFWGYIPVTVRRRGLDDVLQAFAGSPQSPSWALWHGRLGRAEDTTTASLTRTGQDVTLLPCDGHCSTVRRTTVQCPAGQRLRVLPEGNSLPRMSTWLPVDCAGPCTGLHTHGLGLCVGREGQQLVEGNQRERARQPRDWW